MTTIICVRVGDAMSLLEMDKNIKNETAVGQQDTILHFVMYEHLKYQQF